jgi:hypothetical protein
VTEPIRGRVAQILTDRELVLNIGQDVGVTKGMRFAVLNSKGLEVVDPETGASLGSVDRAKVLVEAVRVQSKLSVARTFRTFRRNLGGRSGLTLDLFGTPPKWVEVPETLRLADKPSEAELGEEESYVKIGDPIVQVVEEEYLPAEE